MTSPSELASLIGLLGRYRYRVVSETELGVAIARILTSEGIAFEKERRLTPKLRIDFLLADGTGIELKTKGPTSSAWRQIHQYAMQEPVHRMLLVSTLKRHTIDIPDSFAGKPLAAIHLRA